MPMRPAKRDELASALAGAFLAGAWSERALARRGASALEPRPVWLLAVVRAVLAGYHRPPHDRPRELGRFIALQLDGLPAARTPWPPPRVRRRFVSEARMAEPRPAWPSAPWPAVGVLAERLELSIGQLEWLADVRSLERSVADERLRNYGYGWHPRGHGLPRLIERPKRRLKEVQRIVLREVLDAVPPHEAAHGFRPGRSATTHAAEHVGRRVVLRFDLEDFFASVAAGRVFGLFRLAGYPESVAHVLTGLCTNATPDSVWSGAPASPDPHARCRLRRRLATPHLPQGAPTSPALANLCAFTLDRRLDGMARAFGARYTRYADDLTISGDRLLVDAAPTVRRLVARIVAAEGFRLRADKTSLVTHAGRQRVCGVVVNERLNVARTEADRLRALLHDARLHGAAAANRRAHPNFAAHVRGRIAWVAALNPDRGRRLLDAYEAVDWS